MEGGGGGGNDTSTELDKVPVVLKEWDLSTWPDSGDEFG